MAGIAGKHSFLRLSRTCSFWSKSAVVRGYLPTAASPEASHILGKPLTVFRIALLEWLAAVDIISSDSGWGKKKST